MCFIRHGLPASMCVCVLVHFITIWLEKKYIRLSEKEKRPYCYSFYKDFLFSVLAFRTRKSIYSPRDIGKRPFCFVSNFSHQKTTRTLKKNRIFRFSPVSSIHHWSFYWYVIYTNSKSYCSRWWVSVCQLYIGYFKTQKKLFIQSFFYKKNRLCHFVWTRKFVCSQYQCIDFFVTFLFHKKNKW